MLVYLKRIHLITQIMKTLVSIPPRPPLRRIAFRVMFTFIQDSKSSPCIRGKRKKTTQTGIWEYFGYFIFATIPSPKEKLTPDNASLLRNI